MVSIKTNLDGVNQRLQKRYKLKNAEEISALFEQKQVIKEYPFLLYYGMFKNSKSDVQIGFGMNRKKIGNAVRRNRVKRIMREGFRLNKNLVDENTLPNGSKLALMLIYSGEKLPELAETEEKIKLLLNRLNKILKAFIQ